MSLPRVMIVSASEDIVGGHAVQASALLTGLRGDGYAVDLIPINPRFPKGLIRLRRYPYIRTLINQALYLARLLRVRHANVVHAFSASYWSFLLAPVPALLAARLCGARPVLHYHSGEADDHLSRWGALVHPWLRLAKDIVVPSEYLETIFKRHGYRARVIQNVVDLQRFSFRRRYPVRPRLISTRNLEPHYRVDTVLEAFASLRAQYPEATLTVVGAGSQEQPLRGLARSLNISPEFAGQVSPDRMPGFYQAADIFCNASIVDNQPVSILEALSTGVSVVSTPTGDIPALIRDRETGLIVPPGSPNAMASAVSFLLQHPERADFMASHGREVGRRYTWECVRDQWAAVYAGSTA